MSKTSPTRLSLAHARKRLGWTAAVCEKWNSFAHIRQDLFGFDILALRPDRQGVTGIQTSTGDHHSGRAKKLAATPAVRSWLEAGNAAEIWTWTRRDGRQVLRRSELRVEDLAAVDLTPRPRRRGKQKTLFDRLPAEAPGVVQDDAGDAEAADGPG